MNKVHQPSLFPELEPKPLDVDAFTTHIAKHAPKDPYIEQKNRERRYAGLEPLPAEVRDQTQPNATVTEPALSPQQPLVELPTRGRDNWHRPSPQEIQEGLTDSVREVGKTGVKAARNMLGQVRGH